MRHQLRPSVDGLENKTLLSHMAASVTAHHHQALQAEVRPGGEWVGNDCQPDDQPEHI